LRRSTLISLLGLYLLCNSLGALAYHRVESFIGRSEVVVTLDVDHGLSVGDRLAVLARESQTLIAIGRLEKLLADETPPRALMRIEESVGTSQVLSGDAVEKLTGETLRRHHVNGHLSLLMADDETVPARYKELAYLGVFNSDGHTLAPKEWLVSLTGVQYGLNSGTTLRTQTSLLLDGFVNAGVKQRLMRNRHGHLTISGLAARQINREDWVAVAGLVLTMPSNSKYQTHLVINASLEGIEEDNPEVAKLNLFPDSDVRTIYEYITDDWDRWLFGPLFNFDTKTVGGTVGHLWIWDTFHLNLGIGTKDVSELEFKSGGYYGVFDFFWRF